MSSSKPTQPSDIRKNERSARGAGEGRARDGIFHLFDVLSDIAQSYVRRHGRTLWWIHSFYALLLGISVVFYAQQGFERARMLAVSVVLAWLLVVLFFRLFGADIEKQHAVEAASAPSTKTRVRFFVMTYVLKNLYQGMLFFLLPFYWKSSTLGAPNFGYVVLLTILALLSTLDLFFDRVVMRRRVFASIFHGLTLFSCLNLLVPTLVGQARTVHSLVASAAITVLAFWSLHAPPSLLRRKEAIAGLIATLGVGVALAYFGRELIPPVPMYVVRAAVGPQVLADGRLAMEVQTLHTSAIQQLRAVTDVVGAGGDAGLLHHVWVHEGHEINTPASQTHHAHEKGQPGGLERLESTVTGKQLPSKLVGNWYVEVRTEYDQTVGRTSFNVIE